MIKILVNIMLLEANVKERERQNNSRDKLYKSPFGFYTMRNISSTSPAEIQELPQDVQLVSVPGIESESSDTQSVLKPVSTPARDSATS